MDPSSGGGRQSDCEMASDNQSVRDISQSLSTSLFCSPQRSDVSRIGCIPSVVGRDASVHLPSVCSHSGGFEQDAPAQKDSSNIDRSSVATEGVVSGSAGASSASSSRPTVRPDLLKQPHLHRFHQQSSTSMCFNFTHGDCAAICKAFRPFE